MRDGTAVVVGQCTRDLDAVSQDGFDRQPAAPDQLPQRPPIHQFHDDVQLAIELADFVYGADVGMAKPGGRARLVQQTAPRRLIAHIARRDHLQRNITVQKLIACAIHDPHSAFADLGDDSIMPEELVDHVGAQM